MSTSFRLDGKLALVTGSARGIGKTLAIGLAEAGADVIIHCRSIERSQQVADEIRKKTGAELYASAFDVTNPTEVDQEIGKLENLTSRTIDILVNNAGMQTRAPITEFAVDDWQRLLDTNITSTFLVSKRVAPGMIAKSRGRIINIGSVQSQLARPGIAPYSATKGAIVMLTKGLTADLAKNGITINAIAPGYFATELTQALVEDEEFSAWVEKRTPAGRWGDTRDLQGPLVFLASDASAFVNGQTLFVDGGMTAVV